MLSFLVPTIAQAQSYSGSFGQVVLRVNDYVLNPLIRLGFVVAIVVFLWGIIQYLRDRDNGTVLDKEGVSGKSGASNIIWGLVGLFIMVSAFSIMKLITTIIGSNVQTP